MTATTKQQPHALMFPFPAPGHINPMIQLAQRLLHEGFFVTFVNTDYNHRKMFAGSKGGEPTVKTTIPHLRFEHVPDGLPEWHQRLNEKPVGLVEAIVALLSMPGPLAKLVRRIVNSDESPPLTCIIADAFCDWVQDVADQFQISRVALWTTPVHSNLAYAFQGRLQSLGLIPVQDQGRLQEVVQCIDGITAMKLEDYISFFLVDSTSDFLYQWVLRLCMKRPDEAAWNLGNNFEELEQEASVAFRKSVPNFLPVGPLLPTDILRGNAQTIAPRAADLTSLVWPEDVTCMEWLSQHAQASVIYISFGNIVNIPEEDVRELILGLEGSAAPFLWVVRPDQSSASLSELREKLDSEAVEGKPSRRALVVPWAPQLSILTHPAVGLFLSHCGWNSVTESIAAGVPILARPVEFDQRMNAHYVAEVWKIGLRLSKGATASVVTSLIESVMGSSVEAARVQKRVSTWRQSALASLSPSGGSAYNNLKLFTDDMHRRAGACQHVNGSA